MQDDGQPKHWNLRTIFGVLGISFVLLLLAGYVVERFRGQKRLEEVEAALEAKGESLDWRELVPARVDDDQNLAAAPLFRSLWATLAPSSTVKLEDTPEGQKLAESALDEWKDKPPKSPMAQGKMTDLAGWQKYFAGQKEFPKSDVPGQPAQDVLLALDRFKPEVDELRSAAVTRPFLHFPLNYQDGFAMRVPHWSRVQKVVEILVLRASALLAENRIDEAFADLQLAQNLVVTSDDERTLIGWLTGVACQSMIRKTIWEGLETHRWNEPQLARFQEWQTARNELEFFQQVMRVERAMAAALYAELKKNPARLRGFLGGPGAYSPASPENIALMMIPRGWVLQNQALHEEMIQHYSIEAFDSKKLAVKFPGSVAAALAKEPMFYSMFVKFSYPVSDRLVVSAARSQNDLQQTAMACALERHRLVHQRFPQQTSELIPAQMAVLPHDVTTGRPMIYASDGTTFSLYSVGWNRKDDAGAVVFKPTSSAPVDHEQGDWAWPHLTPPKP